MAIQQHNDFLQLFHEHIRPISHLLDQPQDDGSNTAKPTIVIPKNQSGQIRIELRVFVHDVADHHLLDSIDYDVLTEIANLPDEIDFIPEDYQERFCLFDVLGNDDIFSTIVLGVDDSALSLNAIRSRLHHALGSSDYDYLIYSRLGSTTSSNQWNVIIPVAGSMVFTTAKRLQAYLLSQMGLSYQQQEKRFFNI